MSSRLTSIGGALVLLCVFGAFSLPWTAFNSHNERSPQESINYAKQTILDLSPIPNQSVRSRIMTSMRHGDLFHAFASPPHLPGPPPFFGLNPSIVELLPPQSLAVFNPNTRSPPF